MASSGRSWSECLTGQCANSMPALAMVIVQLGFAGMNIISKVALNQGMSPFALVFYRHLVATLVTVPLACIIERKTRPKMTCLIFCEIFVSSFFGVTLNQNLYYTGLNYTSATFACALSNTLPAITFVMAVLFRQENVGIRSLAGKAKVVGTIICVSGAMIMTFYKGAKLHLWPSPVNLRKHSVNNANASEDWTKGSVMVIASCIAWSLWFIMQAKISKKYSAPYSSTAIMCFFVTLQTGLLTAVFERHNPSVWHLGWNVKLLTVIYSGVVASAMAFCILSWCIRRKGALFVSMFSPLLLIMVAIMGSIVLDERLHLGSVLGSILIVTGLYTVLWGKRKEAEKVAKIPRRDSVVEESINAHNLSNNPGSTIACKQSITTSHGVTNHNETPTRAAFKPNQSNQSENGQEISTNSLKSKSLVQLSTDGISANHVAVDCSRYSVNTEETCDAEGQEHTHK